MYLSGHGFAALQRISATHVFYVITFPLCTGYKHAKGSIKI